MNILRIYTDGACSGNQNDNNIGGWGACLEYAGVRKELYGGEANTSNNKMELTAVIEAFKALNRQDLVIQVFTDSSYVSNCFKEKWYEYWESHEWKTKGKKDVENPELWKELLALVRQHKSVEFFRVKGHINLNSKVTDFQAHYEKFVEINGPRFSFEEWKYIVEMNNLVDGLANKGFEGAK
ncbi:MAG: ribonuclease HI [Clostridia bacterium]|nr:ribonuclease HI [Clostridia bacterium]